MGHGDAIGREWQPGRRFAARGGTGARWFHEGEQQRLTRRYLVPALDTLRWIQGNRRIFFLGSWLASTLGGQSEREALAIVDGWLARAPGLPTDLRQKVLQARDELERTVRIRGRYGDAG